MPINVQCSCGKRMGLADALAGKSVRCSSCGESIPVPMASAPAPGSVAVKKAASPAVYISTGKIVGAIAAVVVLVLGLMTYFGPLSVWRQWEDIGPKASDDIRDVISFGLQAYLSTHGGYDPTQSGSGPSVDGGIAFIRPTMVMSMPDKIPFKGKSSQGDFVGTYSPKTGEIDADVYYGGRTVAGMVDLAKATDKFHMTGRNKNGQPEAEADGAKLTIYYPPPRKLE